MLSVSAIGADASEFVVDDTSSAGVAARGGAKNGRAVDRLETRLGAGRARKEDPVQAGAGIEIFAKPGDRVVKGQPILRLHTDEPDRFERAIDALGGTLTVGEVVHASEPGVSTGRGAPPCEPRDSNGTDDAAARKPRRPAAGKPRRSVVLERLG